jgi:hypothetical protein
MNIEVITQRAGYKRGTYYLHIKKKDLPVSILNKYAKAIGHDFSEDIDDMPSSILGEPEFIYGGEPATIEEAIQQRNQWKEKYYALMEKYVQCMEKK